MRLICIMFIFHRLEAKAAGKGLGRGGTNHRGLGGDGSLPAGSRDGAPVGDPGDEVSEKLKSFKSSYKQILRIF